MWTTTISNRRQESGMTLIAVMAVMAIFAVALLAVAPTIATEIQRERELEAIARGEEVAEAIRAAIAEAGASSIRDMGKVMAILKPKLAGRADMSEVSKRVKAALAPQ